MEGAGAGHVGAGKGLGGDGRAAGGAVGGTGEPWGGGHRCAGGCTDGAAIDVFPLGVNCVVWSARHRTGSGARGGATHREWCEGWWTPGAMGAHDYLVLACAFPVELDCED